jgi:hypothetical protein
MNPQEAVSTYLDIVDSVAPGLVEGLYIVGSVALDDWVDGASDVDVVVVTAEPCTDDDVGSLRTVHALLTEQLPRPFIDGPYLAWGDLVVEPGTGLHRPWTLNGQLHHDGDCFEINPITWYTLATRGVLARGPAISRLGIPTDVEARVRFVTDNIQAYWASVADDVARACEHDPRARFDAASFVWCALGALRQHYTAFTGDVVSKRGAGEYGLQVAPVEHHDALRAALAFRAAAEQGEVDAALMVHAVAIIRWCVDEVKSALPHP